MNPSIPIPLMLQARKRWHGMPVPFVNLVDKKGLPDFRAIDEAKRLTCIRSRLCQLCGRKLKVMIFAGGPNAAKGLLYFEPGLHLDCMLYAMQTCPFILGQCGKAEAEKVQKRHEGTGMIVVRDPSNPMVAPHPDQWVLTLAADYVKAWNGLSNSVHLRPTQVIWQSQVLHAPSMKAEDWQQVREEIQKEIMQWRKE